MSESEMSSWQHGSGLGASDPDIWRAAADGDHAAFHVLVDRHGPQLFQLALSLAGNRSDAEDICQETFVAAFCGLKGFDGRASVKTWLTSILMRRAAKAWKKQRQAGRTNSLNQRSGSGNDDDDDNGRENPGGALADQFSVDPATVRVDQRLDVIEMIRTLPPEFRDTIVLREIQGLSYQEIADVLGVPRGTVESRLYRGRAQLRRKLTGY